MSAVADVLAEFGVADFTEGDLARVLRASLTAVPQSQAAPLSVAARQYVEAHGGETAGEAIAGWDPLVEQRRRRDAGVAVTGTLLRDTWSAQQVAEQVGKDPSRVRHWMTQSPRQLYSVKIGSRRRVPRWQIVDGAVLPGLAAVVAAIPDDIHPIDIATVMTTEQDHLGGRTPVEHLSGGGDPGSVVEVLISLTR